MMAPRRVRGDVEDQRMDRMANARDRSAQWGRGDEPGAEGGIVISDERQIWRAGRVSCVMVSCCAGAELQIRRDAADGHEIVLRELYPSKSDLYERARALEDEHCSPR